MSRFAVIIPAAGQSSRFGGVVKKPFVSLDGRPVWQRAAEPFWKRTDVTHVYVVVAPGFPLSQLTTPGGPTGIDIAGQPRDIAFVLDRMLASNDTPGDRFHGAIDATRIASVGLSMGGLTSLLVGYHATLRDPRVDVVVAMAPVADILGDAFYDTSSAPLLLLSGDIDAIVRYETNARAALERANAPVNLYTLVDGTHTSFTSTAVGFAVAYWPRRGGGTPPA